MNKILKGKDVFIAVDGTPVAGSTLCSLTLTANTADAATKSDPGDGMWDRPMFSNYSWTMSNESFVVSIEGIQTLLQKVINGDGVVSVILQDRYITPGMMFQGTAIITSLQISAPNNDKASISISLDGCGSLEPPAEGGFDMDFSSLKPLKGKSLMVALADSAGHFHTLAASTSHSLTVNIQTSETTTKDDNDMVVYKEATGKSVSLSTENLVMLPENKITGVTFSDLMTKVTIGEEVSIAFGYYPESIGAEAGEAADWGTSSQTRVYGTFLCTSLNVNAAVKDNATYSAEFASIGDVSLQTVEE